MKKIFVSAAAFAVVIGCTNAWAAARIESVTGDVSAVYAGKASKLQKGQNIETGTVLTSQKDSGAVLKFDDGQIVVVSESSEFKISDYHYDAADPKKDRSVMELVRGAMRFLSGAISKRNHEAVSVKTPQATIGVRGTDFMVAIGSLLVTVGQGAVQTTINGVTYTFGSGTTWYMSGPGVVPQQVVNGLLPSGQPVPSNFQPILNKTVEIGNSVSVPQSQAMGYAGSQTGAVTGAAAGGTAGTAAAGSITFTAVGVAAGVAAAAVAISASEGSTGTTTATSTAH